MKWCLFVVILNNDNIVNNAFEKYTESNVKLFPKVLKLKIRSQ